MNFGDFLRPHCVRCEEPIEDPSIAPRIMVVDEEGSRQEYMHKECLTRVAIGGLNHLKGTCQCCGGNDDPDPPGMTKREAAIAAVAHWEAKRPPESGA